MKTFKLLFLAFSIVGLLVSISMTEVQAGFSCPETPTNVCVSCCKDDCDTLLIDCSGATTGEERSDCRLLNNIRRECCYFDCVEGECGLEAGDSIVCEALEDLCSTT